MIVTNADVLRFYADKPTDKETCPKTTEYMESHKPSGEYIKLANTFQKEGQTGSEENKCFYHWLKDNYASMISLSALMEKNPDFDFLLKNTIQKDAFLQKWHLYVSWYALEEYWAKEDTHKKSQFTVDKLGLDVREDYSGILRKNNPIYCRALLLWMCETSGSERINELYKQLKDIEAQLEDANNQLSEWMSNIKEEIVCRVQAN